tara:strand:- start:255 stop:518 length:264 start_codon:yes stop_codon:yes gene_type:complete
MLSYETSFFNLKLCSTNNQKVFHVVVRNYTGELFEGWVRTGSVFEGANCYKTVEVWKDGISPKSMTSTEMLSKPPPLPREDHNHICS